MKDGVVAAVDLIAPIHVPGAQESILAPPQELHLVCRCVRTHYLAFQAMVEIFVDNMHCNKAKLQIIIKTKIIKNN